jgi:stress-induced morphogen
MKTLLERVTDTHRLYDQIEDAIKSKFKIEHLNVGDDGDREGWLRITVVSPDFASLSMLKRIRKVLDLIHRHVDVGEYLLTVEPFSIEEFEWNRSILAEDGIRI